MSDKGKQDANEKALAKARAEEEERLAKERANLATEGVQLNKTNKKLP